MKTLIIRAALIAASLSTFACSSAPEEPNAGTTEQAMIPTDGGFDPEPDPGYDATPPPPPPATTTCTNSTNDGVCRRYCCTTSSTFKRCGVLPCPTSPTTASTLIFTGTVFAK